MIKNFNEAKNIQIMFLKYFQSSLSPVLIIFSIYVLICAVSIFKYSLKNIILTVLGFLIVYLGYLLVYDVTYINYLISLRLDEVFRELIAQYLKRAVEILEECIGEIDESSELMREIEKAVQIQIGIIG